MVYRENIQKMVSIKKRWRDLPSKLNKQRICQTKFALNSQAAYTDLTDNDDLIKNSFWILKIKKEKCLNTKRHVVKKH